MPIEESLTLSRIEVERYIEPVIAQCLDLVQRALAGARLEANAIDRVIMVGGPTQIPVIRAALVSVLGNKMDYSIDPRSFSNDGDIKACDNLVALQCAGDAVSFNANCLIRKTCFQYRPWVCQFFGRLGELTNNSSIDCFGAGFPKLPWIRRW